MFGQIWSICAGGTIKFAGSPFTPGRSPKSASKLLFSRMMITT